MVAIKDSSTDIEKITLNGTDIIKVMYEWEEIRPRLRSWEEIIAMTQADAITELNKHPSEYYDKFRSEWHTTTKSDTIILNHTWSGSSSSTHYQIEWTGYSWKAYNWGWSWWVH